ncbi:MAG: hypothetical protein QOF76_4575 [Solirubrobacteraceae bacterium]|nr:hypothetical protein [Solirubrobacteraceae bacterium]
MTALSRHYAKLCDVADFDDAAVLAALRDIFPEREPQDHLERKAWEYAMAAMFLEEAGHLNDDSRLLGVGAGDERIAFWLANHAGAVVATDIYGDGDFASGEAPASMLTDPASHAPFPYREDRLTAQWMDARNLDFPDASFDAAFSISSFEHFGAPSEIAAAAAELGRVLRPGGHAVVITECWVRRHPLNALMWSLPGRKGVDVLTAREIEAQIVSPSGLRLLQPLDTSISEQTWANVTQLRVGAPPQPSSGAVHPHVLMRYRSSVFTSVCLVLEKPR